jgi:hypothetical protein
VELEHHVSEVLGDNELALARCAQIEAETIELCAKVCEEESKGYGTADDCAKRISALKTGGKK